MVENISLPPEVEKALDKRTSMGMIGDLNKYIQFGAAESMTNNTGGGTGNAIEMGLGFAMANKMANEMDKPSLTSPTVSPTTSLPAPPPLPDTNWHVAIDRKTVGPLDLSQLQQLASNRQISQGTLAWIDGMKEWQSIETIKALDGLFEDAGSSTATPPKLPEKQ